MMLTVAGVVLTAALGIEIQTSTTTGSIVGCISDTSGQRLSGATVSARSPVTQSTTDADGTGCYELRELPARSYRVTARLSGFDNVTRDGVKIIPSMPTRADFTTRASPICECVRITGGLAELWSHANAVLQLRLFDAEPSPSASIPGYYRHRATVVHALKKPAEGAPVEVFVLQNQRSGTSPPYDVGQELIAFLQSASPNTFRITNDEPGLAVPRGSEDTAMVFLVQDGRIGRTPTEFSSYLGMPVDAFLAELRNASPRR